MRDAWCVVRRLASVAILSMRENGTRNTYHATYHASRSCSQERLGDTRKQPQERVDPRLHPLRGDAWVRRDHPHPAVLRGADGRGRHGVGPVGGILRRDAADLRPALGQPVGSRWPQTDPVDRYFGLCDHYVLVRLGDGAVDALRRTHPLRHPVFGHGADHHGLHRRQHDRQGAEWGHGDTRRGRGARRDFRPSGRRAVGRRIARAAVLHCRGDGAPGTGVGRAVPARVASC